MEWKTIAQVLMLDSETINHIARLEIHDRVKEVFKEWLENALDLLSSQKYPLSWYGLNQLLIDSQLEKIANEYFEFLKSCDKHLF